MAVKKGCLISIVVVVGLIIAFFAVIGIAIKSIGKESISMTSNTYLVMDINAPLLYEKHESFFGSESATFTDILKAIDDAADDSDVKGIIIKNCRASLAQQEEILEKIKAFKKSGKKIIAYAPSFSTGTYLIASTADDIILPPTMSADFSLAGYYLPQSFYKRMFDKIGIEFTVVHMGNYKGAGENFSRENMSPYLRENLTSLFDDLFGWRLETIANNRSFDPETFKADVYNGNYFMREPKQALDLKLVTSLLYEPQFREKYLITEKNLVSLSSYASSRSNAVYGDKIAVIIAEGEIVVGRSTTSFSPLSVGMSKMLGSETFCENVESAVKDTSVKGIVVRVDSPGGSALASDMMWYTLKKAAEKKPVYISMGQVAASGGYYISTPGKVIFADNSTITGSIGVVSMMVNTSELMEDKLYIDTDTLQHGKYADFGSANKKMTNEEIEMLRSMSLSIYTEFKSRVAEGRKMSMDDVEKIAQGKVYTGRQALKIGLVDKIGTLDATVTALKNELKLKNVSVVYYPKKKTFMETMKENGLFGMSLYKLINKPESVIAIDPKPRTYYPYSQAVLAE